MFTRVGAYLRPGADGGTVEFYNNDEQKQAKDNVYGPALLFLCIYIQHTRVQAGIGKGGRTCQN